MFRSLSASVTALPFTAAMRPSRRTLGVLVDVSGSMGWAVRIVATLAWAFSDAMTHVHGVTATVAFGSRVTIVTPHGTPPSRVTPFTEGVGGQALKRVDEEARGLRVVVTSRPGEYRRTLHADRPDNTAVIELRPIRPAAATAYLLHGQAGPNRPRWEQVGAYLTQNPASVAAQALDNPLTLSLARDTYASHSPAALTEPGRFPTVDAIREHLIDQV